MTAGAPACGSGPAPRAAGLFVTLEGGEGAGKTSAAEALAGVLRRAGFDVAATREPGGTPASAAIRALVVQGERDWTPLAELLLLMADRAEHVARTIRPALASGRAALCDRFDASTYAYQGAGKGLERTLISSLQSLVAPGLSPDLTLLLDVEPETGLSRSAHRLSATHSDENRFEALDLAFHRRVRASFLEQAAADARRWIVVDANRPLDLVLADAVRQFESRLAALLG